jgi:hypothetical protein
MQIIDHSTTLTTDDNDYSIVTLDDRNVVAVRFVVHVLATSYSAVADRRRLKPRGIRWLESRTNRLGRPVNYIIDGSTMYLYGVPSSTENGQLLRIGAYVEPTPLADFDTTVLNTYYDRPLLKYIQAFAEADLGDRAKALITLKEAGGLLNNAVDENELEAEDEGHQVEVMLQSAMGF